MIYITTGILLVTFLTFREMCEGQGLLLTTSPHTATEGKPLTFTCTATKTRGSRRSTEWEGHLRTGQRIILRTRLIGTCRVLGRKYRTANNYKCDFQQDSSSLTIQAIDFQTYHNSTWNCNSGTKSNVITLDVNVPLLSVTYLNSTNSFTMIEGDVINLVCKTGPTRPPSTIVWKRGNQILTHGARSLTHEEGGLTTTVGVLSVASSWQYNRQTIQCVGQYNDVQRSPATVTINTHVPLVDVNVYINETEADIFTVTCETNPTFPPSKIVWMKGGREISRDVVTKSRDIGGKTLTTCSFSPSCSENIQFQGIYCMGVYMDKNVTSPELLTFIRCKANQDLSLCVGVGAGVGAAAGLVAALVSVLCARLRWRHRFASANKTMGVTTEVTRLSTYDRFEENTRQRNLADNYEDLRQYEVPRT